MVYRYTKEPSQRQLQVAESIKKCLMEVFLRNELGSNIFDYCMITVSEVRISADLKLATVFIVANIPSNVEVDIDEIIAYLNSSVVEIVKVLKKKIVLRSIPHIRFVRDNSFDEGRKLDDLLKNVL